MADETTPYVARDADLDALRTLWADVQEAKPHVVRVQAPFGGGRRALCGEFLRELSTGPEDVIVWRVMCLDQENGLQWLIRMYGALMAVLNQDLLRRGKVEMILNSQLPSQPKRVQGWFQGFISALKEAKTDDAKGAVQLRLPQDNPLIGLVEVVAAISRRQPVVLELQNPGVVYSLALAQFVETLFTEVNESGGRLMILMHDEPESETTQSLYPVPLLDMFKRQEERFDLLPISPWGEQETGAYLQSKGWEGDAARIAEIAQGRPGFIAELVEILEEKGLLGGDLSEVTMASLVPLDLDESELEVPAEAPAEGERKHAGAADVSRVVFLAALLGQAFPSNLVADMGGFDRDSIDDIVDALDDLFDEVQFSKELGTWIYRFKRGSWREGIIEHNASDEGNELARRVGLFMERYLVPRGYGFIVKTARVYAEHGAPARAALMRSIALTNDAPDVWGLSYDLTKYFDEIDWPDAMKRTIFMNLVDRLVGTGTIQAAERVITDATTWATDAADREMEAWLLFAGSRLDSRRQDLYRARDRARDAIKLYTHLENKVRCAEIHNHLAAIEMQDGNPNAAMEHVNQAMELGQTDGPEEGQKLVPPGVLGQAEHIRGLVARRAGRIQEAADHFRRANEVAGQAGLGPLALDAGLNFGEALLASGQHEQARQVLGQVVNIARNLRSAARERGASELLAQAEGALKNFPAAIQHATRTLELSQQLKFEQVLPLDLFNLGRFHYMNNKPNEALTFLRQSQARVGELGEHPVVREIQFFTGAAQLAAGQLDDAKASLQACLRPAQAAKDWPRMISALDALAAIEQRQGNVEVAKKLLTDAIAFARKADLRAERKELKRKLDRL